MKRWALPGLLGLAACGRLGFDPPGGGTPGDDAMPGDGPGSSIDGTMMMLDAAIDAAPTACAAAIPINLGRTGPTSTCALPDLIDSCAGSAKQEVIFKFTASASAGHTFAAYNPGTQNVSNSTQMFDATCTLVPSCAAVTGRSFAAGQIVYFVVEASTAACAMIEFQISSP